MSAGFTFGGNGTGSGAAEVRDGDEDERRDAIDFPICFPAAEAGGADFVLVVVDTFICPVISSFDSECMDVTAGGESTSVTLPLEVTRKSAGGRVGGSGEEMKDEGEADRDPLSFLVSGVMIVFGWIARDAFCPPSVDADGAECIIFLFELV